MKYNIGMYGGTFSPLHLGHVNNIITASNNCNKLYVVVSESDNKDEIDKISKKKLFEKYMREYPKLKTDTPIKLVKCSPISLYIIPLIKAEMH